MSAINASLEWKVEEAVRLWLLDSATHGIALNCDVRHSDADTSNENLDGSPKVPELDFPFLILKASRIKQLTPALNITLFRLETTLWVSADDTPPGTGLTPEELYQSLAHAREQILLWDELAARLSAAVEGFLCNGVQEFAPSAKTIIDRRWTHRLDVLLWAQPED